MKLKTEMMHVFMYTELEKLLKELYGIDIDLFDLMDNEQINHYTYQEFTVDGDSELLIVGDDAIVRKWVETGELRYLDMSDVPEYWDDTASVGVEHIMHRLFIEGHIPAGKYLMQVDW
jgi:hypothetical protein